MEPESFSERYNAWRVKNGLPRHFELPPFRGMELRLVDIWTVVCNAGGSRHVVEHRKWSSVSQFFRPLASITNCLHHLKVMFIDHMLEFERSIDPDRVMLKQNLAPQSRLQLNTVSSDGQSQSGPQSRHISNCNNIPPLPNAAALTRHHQARQAAQQVSLKMTRAHRRYQDLLQTTSEALNELNSSSSRYTDMLQY